MPKRPVAIILLQVALILASIILIIIAWRVYTNPNWTTEQHAAVNESLMRMIATILLFVGTFIALWFRMGAAKILSIISLGWLSYSTISIVTNSGKENKRELYQLGFEDLSYSNVGVILMFIAWFYALLASKKCQDFFD